VVAEALVEVVDLEKDPMPVGIERAKVVLLMRIIGVAKVVENGDGLYDAGKAPRAAMPGVITAIPSAKF
jgi:hypothetical protein